ncbi:MAG TPA: sulfurtransferase TusA family protein [Nitrososphaerales archaeon]|nr:sulfurtransferase TusA family protein [Nitrososphaerales archaeon]
MKIEHCEFPDDLLYDLEHWTWGRLRGGTLRVGITTLLSWSMGTFSAVSAKDAGTAVDRGHPMGSLEGSRHFDVVRTPVSGTITLTNDRLRTEPELVNRDPYGEGWLAEIKVRDEAELGLLGRLPNAAPLISQQIRERNVRCFAAFPDYELFDIGVECAAVLAKLNELLGNSQAGTVVHIVSDDSSAEIEMQRWADQTGNDLLESRKESLFYHFIVRKKS